MLDIPDTLRQKLASGSTLSAEWFDAALFPNGTRFVPKEEIEQLFQMNDNNGWERFATRFP
jgi:hypothetical protein